MFTGIVERKLKVQNIHDLAGRRSIILPNVWTDIKHGESIAINGVCLTVAELSNEMLRFDAIPETLSKTNLGLLTPGCEVNIERSLRVGDRIDGHFVQGHVDGTGELVAVHNHDADWRLIMTISPMLAKYLAPKGSICIDGVSLTIASLDHTSFSVALIPTTLDITTLGSRKPGYKFNIECDMMAKSIVTFLGQILPRHQNLANDDDDA